VARVGQEQRAELNVHQDQDGRYHRHLQAASNRIIAWPGQAYHSECWCVQDLNWARRLGRSVPGTVGCPLGSVLPGTATARRASERHGTPDRVDLI
jgi:uncharacterized protein YegP (UPF0339 family)